MVSLHPCQLTKPADCQALVDLAVDTFGRIDVLFNNAAMAYFNWIEDITGNLPGVHGTSPNGPGAASRTSHGKIVLRVA